MAKEITDNPYADLKYEADVQSSNPAIKAYFDAKDAARGVRTNWDMVSDLSGQALGAIQDRRTAIQEDEDKKRKELEGYEEQFSNNVLKITESAGSLGEEYFGIATEEAKKMQQEYMEAVRNKDKETQTKLKMKLNGLSTSVQSLKENLTLAAELQNNESISNGRTREQKLISATCTDPANIVYQDGEWKWKNPKHDPSIEGSKEFFTQEDFNNSLPQKDEVTSKAYLDYEKTMNESGYNYVEGTSAADFNYERIKASIGDQFINQNNIMSIMHDDFTKRGMSNTFAANLKEHLGTMNTNQPGFYASLGIDANKDGKVNSEDWDSQEDIKVIMDVITNNKNPMYKYETSKSIIADWLTLQAKNKFYGDANPDLVPNHNETVDEFKKRGGIVGRYFNNPTAGVVYKEIDGVGTFVRVADLEALKKQFKVK